MLGSYDFISGLIYQTLIKVTCEKCSLKIKDMSSLEKAKRKDTIDRLFDYFSADELENVRFVNEKGCSNSNCLHGITGRTVVAEIITLDAQMRSFFSEGRDLEAVNYYLQKNGNLIIHHGIEKVLDGTCDPFNVENKLGRLTEANIDPLGLRKSLKKSSGLNKAKKINVDNLESSLLKGDKKEKAKILSINKDKY